MQDKIQELRQLSADLRTLHRASGEKFHIGSEYTDGIARICAELANDPNNPDAYNKLLVNELDLVNKNGTRRTMHGEVNYVIEKMKMDKIEAKNELRKEALGGAKEEPKEFKGKCAHADAIINKMSRVKELAEAMQAHYASGTRPTA